MIVCYYEDIFLFARTMADASLPTVNLSCVFSDVTAFSITYATSSGDEDP
jgi:hypothetical protein